MIHTVSDMPAHARLSKRKPAPIRRRVRLRQLELLAALEHTPTLSAAAREVHVSQPAASRLLGTLAADLGIDLFSRAGRGLRPTAAGRALIRRAASLIGNLDRAQAELEAIRDGLMGSTTVGAGVGACYALLPRALSLLLSAAPNISVALREGPMEELLLLLRDGRLDMVVGRMASTLIDRDLVLDELYDPPMRIVAGPAHPLARARRIDWPRLLEEEWILPEAGTPMRAGIETMFRHARRRPTRCLVESSSIQTNVALLSERRMLWVLSADIAAHFAALGALKVLPLPKLRGPAALTVVHLRDRPLSPAALRLLDCLRRATRDVLLTYGER
jgi:DNA-binding transcriptional LysR family regulator